MGRKHARTCYRALFLYRQRSTWPAGVNIKNNRPLYHRMMTSVFDMILGDPQACFEWNWKETKPEKRTAGIGSWNEEIGRLTLKPNWNGYWSWRVDRTSIRDLITKFPPDIRLHIAWRLNLVCINIYIFWRSHINHRAVYRIRDFWSASHTSRQFFYFGVFTVVFAMYWSWESQSVLMSRWDWDSLRVVRLLSACLLSLSPSRFRSTYCCLTAERKTGWLRGKLDWRQRDGRTGKSVRGLRPPMRKVDTSPRGCGLPNGLFSRSSGS